MRILDLVNPELINLNLMAKNKQEVIDELVTLLYNNGKVKNAKKFTKAILAREKLSSTGIGFGVAIPHAKDKVVEEAALAIGISKKGIDYQSLDGELAYLFFMIAAPEKGHDVHLDLLSKLARLLMHEEFRESLLKAETTNDLVQALEKYEKVSE